MFGAFAPRRRAREAMARARSVGARAKVSEVEGLIPVVVVDHEGRPIGLITEEEVEYARRRGLMEAPVSLVMAEDPITVREDEPLESAFRRMEEAGARYAPVVDSKGRLVGLLAAELAAA